eukprot:7253335-Pyramimonas_sp.AAC.1
MTAAGCEAAVAEEAAAATAASAQPTLAPQARLRAPPMWGAPSRASAISRLADRCPGRRADQRSTRRH